MVLLIYKWDWYAKESRLDDTYGTVKKGKGTTNFSRLDDTYGTVKMGKGTSNFRRLDDMYGTVKIMKKGISNFINNDDNVREDAENKQSCSGHESEIHV